MAPTAILTEADLRQCVSTDLKAIHVVEGAFVALSVCQVTCCQSCSFGWMKPRARSTSRLRTSLSNSIPETACQLLSTGLQPPGARHFHNLPAPRPGYAAWLPSVLAQSAAAQPLALIAALNLYGALDRRCSRLAYANRRCTRTTSTGQFSRTQISSRWVFPP